LFPHGVPARRQDQREHETSTVLHGVVAPLPQVIVTLDDDDGGVFTFTVGAAKGVPPVVVVVVVVVGVVVVVPPFVGALASDFRSLEQALVTEGAPPLLHVGHVPPETVALPPSPPHALARAPSAMTSIRRRQRIPAPFRIGD
jgi:hypothetical protein